jgi:hypothetical protein
MTVLAPQKSLPMAIITPVPTQTERYKSLAPGAEIIDFHDAIQHQGPIESLIPDAKQSDINIVIVINRPPLLIDQMVNQLRSASGKNKLYILVVTPHDVEYRHQADLDVDDYVFLTDDDISASIFDISRERFQRNIGMRDRFIDATRTARSAMDSASEYGSLVHFFEVSEQCLSIDSLADAIFEFLSNKNLTVDFRINKESDTIFRPVNGSSTARRHMLNKMNTSQKRMVSVEKLLGYHFEHFTLLISDAPVHQPEKYGQLKDSLAHFCTIVESRVKHILIKDRIAQQHADIVQIMDLIRNSTKASKNHINRIMNNLVQEIEVAATTFDMNLAEEEKLLEVANQATDSLYKLQENDHLVESHFLSLIETIASIQSLANAKTETVESSEHIELF